MNLALNFERHILKISSENDKIAEIQVLRTNPYNSTLFVADGIIRQDLPIRQIINYYYP